MNIFDKIFIREAIVLLDIPNKPIDHVIHSLMNDKKLTTYFDFNVPATTFAGIDMRPINHEGDELPYVDGAPPTEIEGPGKKILEADVVGEDKISVRIFEHEGKQYCGADSEGTHPEPIILGFDYIYFEKSEFDSYQDVPAYQDENHEYYAPELDLAIQLHKAIHIDKYGNQSQNRVARVTNWLNANYPDQKFPNAEIERLSAIIRIAKPREK
jgi:hypothetical protein